MPEPRLPPNQQLIRTDRWPLVGEKGPRCDDSPWTLTVAGMVTRAAVYTLSDLQTLTLIERTIDIHCVTRWSRFDMEFRGYPLDAVMPDSIVDPAARFISFIARTDRAHSSSLPLTELRDSGAFLATHANGQPLTRDHGGPLRLIVPGKYFYKSVKWLERIECLAEDRLGYWEADAGYHNGADPWLEQRYMAPTISKQEASQLITALDFSGRDLRSIDAASRELPALQAAGALLRDADFRNANLMNADFRDSNLSNAHFDGANLAGACFVDADIEGACFAGADLRNTDLRVASMFGASFVDLDEQGRIRSAAKIDGTTRVDVDLLAALTEDQRDFVLTAIA